MRCLPCVFGIPNGGTNELLGGYSGIRNVQDMQVARYPPHKRESDLLHGVRVLWVQAICLCYQDGFPSASRSEKKGSGLIIISPPLFFFRVPLLARCPGKPDQLRLLNSLYSVVQQVASSNEERLERLYSNPLHSDGRSRARFPAITTRLHIERVCYKFGVFPHCSW